MEKKMVETMVTKNLDLVEIVAAKLCYGNSTLQDDLMSIGYEALTDAALRYEDSKGASFRTFAYRTIWGEMMHEVDRWQRRAELYGGEIGGEDDEFDCRIDREGEQSWHIVDRLMKKARLSEREERVVMLHYGIDTEKRRTEEIADEFRLTPQMINYIRRQAIEKMRLAA